MRRIAFFGTPASALPSLRKISDAGHAIPLIITQPDRPTGRGRRLQASPVKMFAVKNEIPVYQPARIRKDPAALGKLAEADPDLNVVVAYGQIIPGPIIFYPRYNSVNLHFSLLPKYRGASPVQWTLLRGETITGVTVFELNEKMDEGDILSQKRVPVEPQETAAELEARLAEIGADLLLETIARIDRVPHRPQDHTQATYAPLIKKDDGRIDWEKSSGHIERQIRAFTPWPSAFTFLRGRRVKILQGRVLPEQSPQASPGQIIAVDKEGLTVCCGRNTVFRIETIQPENKKPMSAHAFSLGTRIKPGESFD